MHNSTLQSGLNLWDCYQNTYFRYSGEMPKPHHLAIITAWNPRSQPRSLSANEVAQRRLIAQLREDKVAFWTLDAGNQDFSYYEPSLAVDINQPHARALCQQYEQNAYYFVSDDVLWLEPVLMQGQSRLCLGAFSHRLIRGSV